MIIPHDITQLFCPGFTLAAGPPSSFTTDIVGCWGVALWRACNLTAFIHSLTGPVRQPFASGIRDPGSIPGGYFCATGIFLLASSRYTLSPIRICSAFFLFVFLASYWLTVLLCPVFSGGGTSSRSIWSVASVALSALL